jgi:hypothetical protein
MISNDRYLLVICVKNIQSLFLEGSNIYKSCTTLKKFTINTKKMIKEKEEKIACISQFFDLLITYVVNHEGKAISLIDKIKFLMHENNWVIERVYELRGIIGPKMETMLCALKEAKDAIEVSQLENLQNAEMHTYPFYGHITILESLRKGWENILNLLKKNM